MQKLLSSWFLKASWASHQKTDSQQVGGSVCFEKTVQSWGFHPGGLSHHHVSVYRRHGCVCLSVPANVYVPQRKKSTEGSCTCAASWLSLDSALHITAWAWTLDLTEVTSMPHHPRQAHKHDYTQTDAQPTQTDRSIRTPGDWVACMKTQCRYKHHRNIH